MTKAFEKMDFEKLVDHFWGTIVLAIGASGTINGRSPRSALWEAMQVAGQWREAYRKREKANVKTT